ncbi:MAG: tRNA glutamyl-Q(34) synthetase GluQRS [Pseudomonadota bacterium]
MTYIGRFAPSPTGDLHLGSLVTALASFLQARSYRGKWLVRIEDIDQPRVKLGADKNILSTLLSHGLAWDGDVIYQSQRLTLYGQHLQTLADQSLLFPCCCNRQRLKTLGGLYDGFCLQHPPKAEIATSQRIHLSKKSIGFVDEHMGTQTSQDLDDFVVVRKDGLLAYQFVVVIDDYLQGITEVVRGVDLLSSTSRQVALFQTLGWKAPKWCHLPLVLDDEHKKLSKQNHALAINPLTPSQNLWDALQLMRQNPPEALQQLPTQEIIEWAISNWRLSALPNHQHY